MFQGVTLHCLKSLYLVNISAPGLPERFGEAGNICVCVTQFILDTVATTIRALLFALHQLRVRCAEGGDLFCAPFYIGEHRYHLCVTDAVLFQRLHLVGELDSIPATFAGIVMVALVPLPHPDQINGHRIGSPHPSLVRSRIIMAKFPTSAASSIIQLPSVITGSSLNLALSMALCAKSNSDSSSSMRCR